MKLEHLFIKREGKIILGANYSNFIRLTIILFLTFLAIGFTYGSLKYLQEKMSNPYSNWVRLDFPGGYNIQSIMDVQTSLNDSSVLERYDIKRKAGIRHFPIAFENINKKSLSFWGVSFDADCPIVESVLQENSGNVISGLKLEKGKTIDDKDIDGIIVTSGLLKKLKIPLDPSPEALWFSMDLSESSGYKSYVKIVSIVKQLPDNSDFMAFPGLRIYYETTTEHNLYSRKANFLVEKNMLETFIKNIKLNFGDKVVECAVEKEFHIPYWPNLHSVRIIFDDEYDPKSLFLNNREKFAGTYFIPARIPLHRTDPSPPYELSINFNSLVYVREFKDWIESISDAKVELSLVESKKNFSYISLLTKSISVSLFIFSVLSIILFISNLLNSHLERIKRNLGTFKAFGLSNRVIIWIYIRLFLIIISFSIILSGLILFIVQKGKMIEYLVSNAVLGFEKRSTIFSLFNWMTIGSAIVLLLITLYLSFRITNIKLKKTPGDLIYNR